jgi:hypothetical protein
VSVIFAAGWWALLIALLRKGKRWPAAIVFTLGLAWLLYSPSILEWVEHLGSDSFSEAQNFDLAEAVDLLGSLNQVLRIKSARKTLLMIALGLALALALYRFGALRLRKRGRATARPVVVCALVVIGVAVSLQLYPAISAFRSNSELYRNIYDNFHGHRGARVVQPGTAHDLNVIVYIGESTSALNMGIYGYPRQTTPELAAFQRENDGLLVFHNVFATHVHTAPSLLEALSVGTDSANDFLPIGSRRRVSIVDILNKAGVSSTLISNQGSTGTWNNLASTVVFRNVDDKEFSFNSGWLGELEHRARRPLDHEFLVAALDKRGFARGPKVLFLHSYAGHGPYLRNVDERFKQPVDDFLRGRSPVAIVGDDIADPDGVVRKVEGYDSTVRYIDHSLVSILRRVKAAQSPSVFVYFSDHGDAVYTGRRHDSSRFVHEMARVPFLVYFNDAAASRYSGLLTLLRSASSGRKISTLAQFPASLLLLFGLEVEGRSYEGIGLDDLEALPPILTRLTGSGYSYIRLGTRQYRGEGTSAPQDVTDPYTSLFLASRLLEREGTDLCQHRSSTIGKALRGAIVANCVWLDVAAGDAGTPTAHPSPTEQSVVDLEWITDIARGYGRSLWIAGEGLNSVTTCRALDSFFDANIPHGSLSALVMFPSSTPWEDAELGTCIGSLRSKGLRTGLELPPEMAMRCSGDVAGGDDYERHCAEMASTIRNIAASGAFTDLGIDFSAASSIDRLGFDAGLGWNAWNVALGQLDSPALSQFRNVAVGSITDPNDR